VGKARALSTLRRFHMTGTLSASDGHSAEHWIPLSRGWHTATTSLNPDKKPAMIVAGKNM
jgi:hypothetical protein